MAFTMNAGFLPGGLAVPSRFHHAERQPEEPHWRRRFEALGLEVVDLPAPAEVRFEAGDAFLVGDTLMGGYGFRSERAALEALGELFGWPVVAARLTDERFYHTDTCFCPLGVGRALLYPGAFEPVDLRRLLDHLPEAVLLTDPQASFAWLDDYEGYVHGGGDANEYDRIVREVRLAGGETFDAWVYLLRRAPDEKNRLVSGRWIGR